jgi:biopolymer transport protein ExbD
MAFSSGDGGGAVSDINITPLVDVMLVLLIIFMVTAPLVQSGIKVDLPNAQAPAMPAGSDDKVRVTVARVDANNPNSAVGVWVGRDQVTMDTLAARLLRDPRRAARPRGVYPSGRSRDVRRGRARDGHHARRRRQQARDRDRPAGEPVKIPSSRSVVRRSTDER